MNPWQRNFGYCDLYDTCAPVAGIIISRIKIPFKYDGKEWMVWIWKGLYGITTRSEIGVYIYSETYSVSYLGRTASQKWYRCANDNERLYTGFTLYKNGKKLFTRPYQLHWWLTGFKLGMSFWWDTLKMDITITFKSASMRDVFVTKWKTKKESILLQAIQSTFHGEVIDMKKVLILFIGGLMIMSFLTGCSGESLGGFGFNKEDCSRESIQSLTSGEFSGTGYADDEIAVLKFVYESEELKEKYGDAFDVDGPIRTRGTSAIIIPRTSLYKGKTTCYFNVSGDKWVVVVKKSYKGKWQAVDCHPYTDDDGEWLAPDDEPDISQENNSKS